MTKLKEINSLSSQLYRSARMGTQTIRTMLSKTKDKEMKKELCRELELYSEIENKIYNDLISRGIVPKDINPLQTASAWITIQMETLFNNKPTNIATILIKGNNMGVIGITKLLNKNKDKNEFLTDYGLEFINLIENNNEKLKSFL